MTLEEQREMLGLAAKAADIEYSSTEASGLSLCGSGDYWNPLTDAGDRYRLARTCKMTIDFRDGRIVVDVNGKGYSQIFDFDPTDAQAEALAIVNAAAEIGRSM